VTFSDDDIILYSKAFYRSYRERSLLMAVERTAELVSSDDLDCVVVWRRVVQQIKDMAVADGLYLGTPDETPAPGASDDAG
jgi:hypothetical protein